MSATKCQVKCLKDCEAQVNISELNPPSLEV